jgi:hypothetical protein
LNALIGQSDPWPSAALTLPAEGVYFRWAAVAFLERMHRATDQMVCDRPGPAGRLNFVRQLSDEFNSQILSGSNGSEVQAWHGFW